MINFTMINGIFDGLATFLSDLWGTLFDFMLGIFNYLFFYIFVLIAEIADMVQALFKAFCGLGKTTTVGNSPTDNVYTLFQSPQITNILISMGVLALLLLIITTAIAVVKTEFVGFSEKGGNSKNKVVGSAFKALGNIIVVPLCSIIAVVGVNAVLRAVDSITAGGENVSLSSQVFVSVAYDANKFRHEINGDLTPDNYIAVINAGINTFGLNFDDYLSVSGGSLADGPESYAMVVDYLFKNNVPVDSSFLKENREKGVETFNTFWNDAVSKQKLEECIANRDNTFYFAGQGHSFGMSLAGIKDARSFDYKKLSVMVLFYDLWEFNIIAALLAILIVAFNLLTIVLNVIKRMFELTIMFIISPPIAAITPLDGGNALKQWRQAFVSSLLSLFGPVVAINMLFIILPQIFIILPAILREVTSSGGITGLQSIAEILVICAAVTYIKDLSGTFSKIIGANNAADTDGVSKAFAKNVKTAKGISKTMKNTTFGGVKMLNEGFKSKAKGKGFGEGFKSGFWDVADDVYGGALGTINDVSGSKFNTKARARKAYNSLAGGLNTAASFLSGGNYAAGYKKAKAYQDANKEFDMTQEQKWARATANATQQSAEYAHQLRNAVGDENGHYEHVLDENGNIKIDEKTGKPMEHYVEGAGIANRVKRTQQAIGDPNTKDGKLVKADQLINRLRTINYEQNAQGRTLQKSLETQLMQLGVSEADLKAVLAGKKKLEDVLKNKP